MNKEKKDVLLIKGNPPGVQRGHPLGEEGLKQLEALLVERTEGKVWTSQFNYNNGYQITRLEHPKGRECTTTDENGNWITYSKNLYLKGDSGLIEPNFKLLDCLGAVVEVADGCPQEDGYISNESLLTIAPTVIIGSCICKPKINPKFNTLSYTIYYRNGEEGHVNNSKHNKVASIRTIEDIADFVTGMLLNNEAIQEKAQERLNKLQEDYKRLIGQWKSN